MSSTPSLKDRISEDMKAAMRAKDVDRLSTIRMLMAAIKQREVDERITLDDVAVVAVVDKLIKQRRDSIAAFEQAGRTDLSTKEAAEVTVLQTYLPARLTADELAAEVRAMLTEIGATTPADMGKAMAAAKARLAGKADMGQVSALIKSNLAAPR